jgi:hypothetical protein
LSFSDKQDAYRRGKVDDAAIGDRSGRRHYLFHQQYAAPQSLEQVDDIQ